MQHERRTGWSALGSGSLLLAAGFALGLSSQLFSDRALGSIISGVLGAVLGILATCALVAVVLILTRRRIQSAVFGGRSRGASESISDAAQRALRANNSKDRNEATLVFLQESIALLVWLMGRRTLVHTLIALTGAAIATVGMRLLVEQNAKLEAQTSLMVRQVEIAAKFSPHRVASC